MSGTKYIASNWRVPENSNSSKNDNYSLSFDPADTEYVGCGNDPQIQLTGNISISVWFKTTSTATMILAAKRDSALGGTSRGWQVYCTGGNIVFLVDRSGAPAADQVTGPSVNDGQWHHVVCTVDQSSEISIILDGSPVASQTLAAGTFVDSGSELRIGYNQVGAANYYFDGDMSEVALFDYILDTGQISTLYGNGTLGAGNPMALKPTPVAYYPLGDNSSGGIDVGPTSILTQPNVSVDDASVFSFDASTTSQFIDIFDGTSGAGPIQFTASDDFSISAWVKTSSLSLQNYILSFRGTALIWLYTSSSSGNIRANLYIRDNSSNVTIISTFNNSTGWIPADTWTNVIATRNGTTKELNIYLNGQSAQTTTTDTTTDDFTLYDKISIGNDNFSGGRYWYDGEISNVAIFDSVVDASTIYNSGIPGDISSLNPAAWYKLDQSANWDVGGSGDWTIPDASGNGNDGTSSGMTSGNLVLSDLTRNLPYENYSLDFDGTDYVDLGDLSTVLSGKTAATVSLWFNRDTTTNQFLLDLKDGSSRIGLQLYFGSDIYFYLNNENYVHPTAPAIDTWYNLIYVFNGSGITNADKLKMYLNGTELTGGTYSGTIDTALGVFTSSMTSNIGRIPSIAYFNGNISNVAIWDTNLSSTEVQKLYANGVPQDLTSFTPQPVSWWTLGKESFWNGSDWIVRDMISSNDGTSANMGVDSLTGDAPRSEANGTGTNMDIPTNLVGNAGFSDKNAYSINMGPSARVTDTP
jgi:hypothetical protein